MSAGVIEKKFPVTPVFLLILCDAVLWKKLRRPAEPLGKSDKGSRLKAGQILSDDLRAKGHERQPGDFKMLQAERNAHDRDA